MPLPEDIDVLSPAELKLVVVRMWPISTRVNKPENDDPSILESVDLPAGAVVTALR
jgi:hypothetical protein